MAWQRNQLVRHKILTLEGIGVVLGEKKRYVKVKFGERDISEAQGHQLRMVEIPKEARLLPFTEWQAKTAAGSIGEAEGTVIVGNEIQQWVGIGWVTIGIIREEDLLLYPIIIDLP